MTGNVYLAGFMGTGKSSVGKRLARRLGRPFVDADAAIERRARLPVHAIFARRGERAFRALEARVVSNLAARRGIVAALGGGALLTSANRRALEKSGTILALTCSDSELWRQLKRQLRSRPL